MAVKIDGNIEIGNTGIKLGEIVESGSNSNGSYIKYGDGTMICYAKLGYRDWVRSTWGSLYGYSKEWIPFPVNFISAPVVNVSISNGYQGGTGAISTVIVDSGTQISRISILRPTDYGSPRCILCSIYGNRKMEIVIEQHNAKL